MTEEEIEDDEDSPDWRSLYTPEYETWYWLTNTPTIEEMRRLNRDTILPWPIGVLFALRDAGVDIDAEQSAVLKHVVIQRPDAIRTAIYCRLDGKLIAVLGLGDRPDGFVDYFAASKRRPAEANDR